MVEHVRSAEHKTVQARILAYAQEIGWNYVSREDEEKRRGFPPHTDHLPQGERKNTERARTKLADICGYPKWVASNPIRA